MLDISWVKRKPTVHSLGRKLDFFRLFAFIRSKYDTCYLFESLGEHVRPSDRHVTFGFQPFVTFTGTKNLLIIEGEPLHVEAVTSIANLSEVSIRTDNPYAMLQQLDLNHVGQSHMGGLVGYLGYEMVNYFSLNVSLEEHEDFPPFKLGLYLDGIVHDYTTGEMIYYTYGEDRFELLQEMLEASSSFIIPDTLESVEFIRHSETEESFTQAVQATLEKVRGGYSFQSEVGMRSYYKIVGDKLAVYLRLREVNPSPYMFFLKWKDMELLGASPEILVSVHGGLVETQPTAGTIRRGKDQEEDEDLAFQLLSDAKEQAEHRMLVDLARNDVGAVSVMGTVTVRTLMSIVRFSHVQHILSVIVGFLRQGLTSFDAVAAILPGGVVTGAPKRETILIIEENEREPRGPYGGGVGRFALNGDCDFALFIRSLCCVGDDCWTQTSAGVVYDSIPKREYEEVMRKFAGMQKTLLSLGDEIHD
jgi:anthranilate synthase component 1